MPVPRGRSLPLEDMAPVFKALSDGVRLRILNHLPASADCERVLNVSELSQELGLPQSTVSRHLAILRHAGLVRAERMCRDVYYWVDAERLVLVRSWVKGLCSGRN